MDKMHTAPSGVSLCLLVRDTLLGLMYMRMEKTRSPCQDFRVWLGDKMYPQESILSQDGESQVQLRKFCIKRKVTLRKELILIEQLSVYLLI